MQRAKSEQMHKAIFRVDANAEIGFGHVMRMRSLAGECLAHGWQTLFCGDVPENLATMLVDEGHQFLPTVTTNSDGCLFDAIKAMGQRPWVVLDGYGFDEAYQHKVLDEGARLMAMDDYHHLSDYAADIIVNQNSGAERISYVLTRGGVCLLGAHYALLRKEFLRWSDWQRDYPVAGCRLLLTVGGADPKGVAFEWLSALECGSGGRLDIHLLAGADNPRQKDLETLARGSRHQIVITRHAADMAGLMAWADLALTAGGSTLWELAFMSLPAVVVCLADNQRGGALAVAAAGTAVCLGDYESSPPNLMATEVFDLVNNRVRRHDMGLAGRKLVDGRGAERVRLTMEAMV